MKPPRILVTRAPHQSSALAEALRALGAEPILIPTIEITDPPDFIALDSAMTELETFDWLVFTSANAVKAFHRRRQHLAPGPGRVFRPKVAAVGPATAEALTAVGLTADLLPPQAVAESLVEALLPHAHPGRRFLLIRAEEARDYLPDALRAAGAQVIIAPAYRTVIPAESSLRLRELFTSPAMYPDAVAFTSSSSVTNLLALLKQAGLELPPGVRRISIGPITSATLSAAGYPAHAEAPEPSVAALAKACTEK